MNSTGSAWQAIFLALLVATHAHAAEPRSSQIRRPSGHPPVLRQHQSFNDLVRQLVASGEVRPLREVLEAVRKSEPGEVVAIKLHHQKPHWVYHLRLLKGDGRLTELDIDGKTLKMTEGK